MALQKSDQFQDGYRKYPVDDHGKYRIQYFSVGVITPIVTPFASGDQIDLFKLPPGRKRLLPHASRIKFSAFGAARTLSLGHRAYNKRPAGQSGDVEVENATVFINAKDVSAALTTPGAWSDMLKYDMYSLDEAFVFATLGGGTMPAGATLEGYLAYIYE